MLDVAILRIAGGYMNILAMESSAKAASVALLSEGKLIGQHFQNNGFTHSKTLLMMAESLLSGLELTPADVSLAAVAKGPGSFTGVRIGVAAVKGFAWSRGIPVCGVSSLEAMAYQLDASEDIIICAVMDARREQVYNAFFQPTEQRPIRLCEDRAISLSQLNLELQHYRAKSILLVGDGAEMIFKQLHFAHGNVRLSPVLTRVQSAYGVALAAMQHQPISAVELEPSYLRPSQAERENTSKGVTTS